MIFDPSVSACRLPAESLLHRRVGQEDFLDCFRVASTLAPRQAAEIIVQFPAWARFLVIIRRFVTAPFGLSNDGPEAVDKLGPFPVEVETPEELIAGFNDRHLDFRVCVLSRAGSIYLATWVHRHNFGGRLYLAMIMPLHILIARNALSRVRAASH